VRLFSMMLLAGLALFAGAAEAAQLVRVGGYDFPPFVESDGGVPRGLTLDLMDALNKRQAEYEFRFVPVSPRRRYADFVESRFDVMFFESPEWEWSEKGYAVDFSNVFLRGGEIFIAPAKPGRGQEYFSDIKGKRIVGILGYHYGFANFNADPDHLGRSLGMKLVNTHRSSIEMVLADRMDVGVVTDAYLWAYLARNPDTAARLLVSERYDQIYNHRILVRRGGPVSVAIINTLMAEMDRDGTLDRLWRSAGVMR
jgi:polar amino acid transport system substrate-binding protein